MAARSLDTPPFVSIVEVPYAALDSAEGLLARMRAGRLSGVLVRGVYSPEQVAKVCARLEEDDGGLRRFPLSSDSEAYSLGALVVTAREGLGQYFDQAPHVAALCERVFEGLPAAGPRLLDVLTKLNAGQPVSVPTHADGTPYSQLSVRHVPAGSELAAHCEKEQLRQASYEYLGPQLDDSTLISCYLALNESGPPDPLVLYDLVVKGAMPHLTVQQKTKLRVAIERHAQYRVPVRPGDVIVFDGGRHYHRVAASAVGRWTMGGFLAFAKDGRTLTWT